MTMSGSWRLDRAILSPSSLFGSRAPTMVTPLSSLVSRLRAGDAAALGEAYDAHHEALRAFGLRLLRDADAAEDLVHDVFVTLPSAIRRFEERSSFRTFLLSIAVNHARHQKRAFARRLGALERLHEEPRHDSGDPEQDRERAKLAEALQRALDELPMEQRIAVVLCVIEERTSVEAAEIAGVPESTVRTRLFHARRKLRDRLESEGVR